MIRCFEFLPGIIHERSMPSPRNQWWQTGGLLGHSDSLNCLQTEKGRTLRPVMN